VIVQVNNNQNQVVVIQQQLETVEVNSIGPKGDKGSKGDKGDTGDSFTPTGSLSLTGSLTATSNISSSAKVSGLTGSFGRLEGLSPITVGDVVIFQQPVTGSVFSGSFVGDGSGIVGISSGGSIFAPTGSVQSTTNNLQITGSVAITDGIELDANREFKWYGASGIANKISGTDSNFLEISSSRGIFIYAQQSTGEIYMYTKQTTISGSSYVRVDTTNLRPKQDAYTDIGTNSLRFKDLYLTGAVTASSYTGSFVGDGSGLTGITSEIERFYLERVETINNPTSSYIEYFTKPQNGTEITNTVSVTGGTYFLECSVLCKNTSLGGRVFINPQIDSSNVFSNPFVKEPKHYEDTFYVFISKRVALSSGNRTIELQLANSGSGNARIFEANIQLTKV
jgi:hypothetical protein